MASVPHPLSSEKETDEKMGKNIFSKGQETSEIFYIGFN
jgi:hypothetical protein